MNENLTLNIDVEKKGMKKMVYLVLSQHERRKIFFIGTVNKNFALRHVKKNNYGALIDMIGFELMLKRINRIYTLITEKITDESNHVTSFEDKWIGKFSVTLSRQGNTICKRQSMQLENAY